MPLAVIHRRSQGAKKIRGNTLSPTSNFGYDDDKGDYKVVPGDHVAYRYEVVSVLGASVVRAKWTSNNTRCVQGKGALGR